MIQRTFQVKWEELGVLVTYQCNFSCGNCISGCGKFTQGNRDDMAFEQIEKLFKQTEAYKKSWRRIWISGGEATLHPQIVEILRLCLAYQRVLGFQLLLVTNGKVDLGIQKAIAALCTWYGHGNDGVLPLSEKCIVINSQKSVNVPAHKTMYVAPVDVPAFLDVDCSNGCGILTECPVILNKYGFYLCAGGSTIDRILGLDIGKKDLGKFLADSMKDQLSQFCKYCGEYKFYTGLPFNESKIWTLSPTWTSIKQKYDASPPTLTLF